MNWDIAIVAAILLHAFKPEINETRKDILRIMRRWWKWIRRRFNA